MGSPPRSLPYPLVSELSGDRRRAHVAARARLAPRARGPVPVAAPPPNSAGGAVCGAACPPWWTPEEAPPRPRARGRGGTWVADKGRDLGRPGGGSRSGSVPPTPPAMNRTTSLLALAGLVALSGCAGLGTFGDYYGDRRDGGYYENDRYDDRYGYDSGYYRAVERDARAYADGLDRYLRISNREERAVREILEYRTYELLEATSPRDHARVYPFPRRRGRAERFWALADRDIDRVLDRRYREPYAYYNRYGAERYQEYYRYRRYDDRRGWVDTRPSRRTPRPRRGPPRPPRGRPRGAARPAAPRRDRPRAPPGRGAPGRAGPRASPPGGRPRAGPPRARRPRPREPPDAAPRRRPPGADRGPGPPRRGSERGERRPLQPSPEPSRRERLATPPARAAPIRARPPSPRAVLAAAPLDVSGGAAVRWQRRLLLRLGGAVSAEAPPRPSGPVPRPGRADAARCLPPRHGL